MDSNEILAAIWRQAGLPEEALPFARLTGADPVLPSSFAVGAAAQSTIAAAALAACELAHARGVPRQDVSVDMLHAALECTGWFSLDGHVADIWDKFSGLYPCADGWVRVHANFAHHRDGALRLMKLDPATATRADAEAAMATWKARDFEDAAAAQGLVVTALRSFDEWDATPQAQALATQPLFTIERIGDAAPLPLPALNEDQRPLSGVRVLDLTRILAGPVGGKALAVYGADVMLINSPKLPNIEAIADTSRGKLSAHADLRTDEGRATLHELIADAHVFVQGYRPGGMAALGFGPREVSALRPGIVCVSLTAYGTQGPWAQRRGFDSLVQTATGFNDAEGKAAGDGKPRALPMQILDEATGYLMAFGAAAALWRQQREGGSWHVQVSLAQTGRWLRSLGRVADGLDIAKPSSTPYVETSKSGFGELAALRHSAQLSRTPAAYARPSVPPGTDAPVWPV
ncbi:MULTISPECIES: CoA transferase [unclassified Variovorax]|uniref:CoA transferase n=1 Tax=unclassified Variovorax TaxID=663243 RepID=UPI0008CBD8B5|nr:MULTISPECIES: CoA transferase [unclassified Variovorax]SEK15974.1 CoA-transferase family III [Variovorax sp. OK202]SFE26604.1 CoA-transferase family III [Variovorax sp. OK212]